MMTIFDSDAIIDLDGVFFYMNKKCFKVMAVSLLLSTVSVINTGCGCHGGEVKVTFVTEENSDIIRYVKKGKSLTDIPTTPAVKGKYCLWDRENFQNLQEDITVTALCYSTVTNLTTNIPSVIDVDVSSEEAKLENIFKDIEIDVTFESGETKKLYDGDYTLDASTYNENVGGSYKVSILYNNAKKDITINVNKLKNYVSVSLANNNGYFNEGLPELRVNSDIEGSVSFDPGQQLVVGSKAYAWTFTPVNSDKYDVVKGSITVNLVDASDITVNKESLSVKFGSTKEEIITKIKEGLVVKGQYGEYFRPIEDKYYTITSTDFVEGYSGIYNFLVTYDTLPSKKITVTVEKCDTYLLEVDDVNEFIIDNSSDLDDTLDYITKSSEIAGQLSFVSGQTLMAGNYEYEYRFDPQNSHYAPKYGKIKIHAYKAESIEFTSIAHVEYGKDKATVATLLRDNIAGKIYYNDGLVKDLDKQKVLVEIADDYDNLKAGEYSYDISYNSEIEDSASFVLNKRQLLPGVDFNENPVCLNFVDPQNYQIMPSCKIQKLQTTAIDYDENLFVLIPLEAKIIVEGQLYEYKVKLVPDESISDNYTTTEFTFRTYIPSGI